jgi:hypothetical protein
MAGARALAGAVGFALLPFAGALLCGLVLRVFMNNGQTDSDNYGDRSRIESSAQAASVVDRRTRAGPPRSPRKPTVKGNCMNNLKLCQDYRKLN